MEGYWIKRVDVYENSAPDDVDIPFRLIKKKWEVAVLFTDTIKLLEYVDFPLGSIRWNHYHHHKREYLYLIEWELRVFIRRAETNDTPEIVTFKAGEILYTAPWRSHAYETIIAGKAIAWTPDDYELVKDDSVRDYVFEGYGKLH